MSTDPDTALLAALDEAIAAGQEFPAHTFGGLPTTAECPVCCATGSKCVDPQDPDVVAARVAAAKAKRPPAPTPLFEETAPVMIDVSCPKCRKRHGYAGAVLDRPPCPRCGHVVPREVLAHDHDIIEQARQDMRLPGFNSRERCKSCGAEILFVATVAGKLMPLDPDPVAGGNVVLDPTAIDWQGAARVLGAGEAWAGERYVSHFATCPNGPAHRRKPQ